MATMKFSQIPIKLPYTSNIKSKLSSIHSTVISYVANHFTNTRSYKLKVLDVLNNLSYRIIVRDDISSIWNANDPLNLAEFVDYTVVRRNIGELYLEYSDVEFDIEETDEEPELKSTKSSKSMTALKSVVEIKKPKTIKRVETSNVEQAILPTPKEDLYIKYPTVPQFNVDDTYISQYVNGTLHTIHKSLPLIPTKQSEISATTNAELMSDVDLMRLYPNRIIHTRDECMYEHVDGMYQHAILGNILPIADYDRDELIDNIIKFPHIFRLCRIVDNEIINMYSSIEINGELYRTMDIWDNLPESKIIPRSASYIKEYVVRRYLLEKAHGIEHKYPIFGAFDEYITLFMPSDNYIELGYRDVVSIARQCVVARVAYKRSRNPILREIGGQ